MPIKLSELEELLNKGFPNAIVEIQDLAGDEDHYSATIICKAFDGKSRIEQHRMVQQVLEGTNIHALSIKTRSAL
jgi:stress-induced morphogen